MPETRKAQTPSPRHDGHSLSKLMALSLVSENRYTCSICGLANLTELHFRMHALEQHHSLNKEPF